MPKYDNSVSVVVVVVVAVVVVVVQQPDKDQFNSATLFWTKRCTVCMMATEFTNHRGVQTLKCMLFLQKKWFG